MAKRHADVDLNQDNWDQDYQTVDSGEFERAEKSELVSRKILTARHNRPLKTGTAGLFKSFTGFTNYSAASNLPFTFGSKSEESKNVCSENGGKTTSEAEYVGHLQKLNENLLAWITKHIKEDPYCILSPIFVDYNKHLNDLQKKFPVLETSNTFSKDKLMVNNIKESDLKPLNENLVSSSQDLSNKNAADQPGTGFKFNNGVSSAISSSPSIFSFTSPNTSTTTTHSALKTTDTSSTKSLFSFALPPIVTSASTAQSLFQFPSVPMNFTFSKLKDGEKAPFASEGADEEGNSIWLYLIFLDDVYVPPKPEVKEVKEEGSVFSIRCKLFYKVDTEWRERGLGNLFIKPTKDCKFQLLIRADTNLGNILLNILVTKDVPIKQQKNNLTIVCVPSPALPSQGKKSSEGGDKTESRPVPMLIRVKTEENATELMKQFDKYRGVENDS